MRDLVATRRGECPNTSMCPRLGYNRPSSILTVVDFPEPFGPSRPKTSPRRTSKSTLSTARAFGRPQKSLKILVKPRTATITSFVVEVGNVGCGVSVTVIWSITFVANFVANFVETFVAKTPKEIDKDCDKGTDKGGLRERPAACLDLTHAIFGASRGAGSARTP